MKPTRSNKELERLKAICRRLDAPNEKNVQRAQGELREIIREREQSCNAPAK